MSIQNINIIENLLLIEFFSLVLLNNTKININIRLERLNLIKININFNFY
ncbi:hypothetical protein GCM10008917_10630 [Paraclostridium tenue]|uniref:Uncharacterized protein n=1 Tax=Paraclostridium tenue TaxID=1737 RepID=A0ABN1M1B2_9FIRM